MDNERKEKKEVLKKAAVEGAAVETIQRYGAAAKEYFVAFEGVDNETGKVYKRSLKSISKSKVNPEFENQNLKQQSGFSAEVLDVADQNAENIINKNPNRKTRTDDIPATKDPSTGNPIGGTNDELFDVIKIEKVSPLILALARDARAVTWFDKNGNQIDQSIDGVSKEFGDNVKDAIKAWQKDREFYFD